MPVETTCCPLSPGGPCGPSDRYLACPVAPVDRSRPSHRSAPAVLADPQGPAVRGPAGPTSPWVRPAPVSLRSSRARRSHFALRSDRSGIALGTGWSDWSGMAPGRPCRPCGPAHLSRPAVRGTVLVPQAPSRPTSACRSRCTRRTRRSLRADRAQLTRITFGSDGARVPFRPYRSCVTLWSGWPAGPVAPWRRCPPSGPIGPAGPAAPCGPAVRQVPGPGVPTDMMNAPRSFSPLPRTTVNRWVPSGTAAGRNITSCVSVALITVIRKVSHHTCGGCEPKPSLEWSTSD